VDLVPRTRTSLLLWSVQALYFDLTESLSMTNISAAADKQVDLSARVEGVIVKNEDFTLVLTRTTD